MSALEPPTSARVGAVWTRRVAAEYGSSALTLQLAHWLTVLAAPPQLILAAMDVARDELDHAERCAAVARAAGSDAPPVLPRELLACPLDPADPLEVGVLTTVIRSFCIGETLAVPLFRRMREGCEAGPARATLDAILADEVRHREFAWIALAWLLDGPAGPDLRARAGAVAGRTLERRIHECSTPLAQVLADSVTPEQRAWGLISAATYREVVLAAVDHEVAPRFARLGVTVPTPA